MLTFNNSSLHFHYIFRVFLAVFSVPTSWHGRAGPTKRGVPFCCCKNVARPVRGPYLCFFFATFALTLAIFRSFFLKLFVKFRLSVVSIFIIPIFYPALSKKSSNKSILEGCRFLSMERFTIPIFKNSLLVCWFEINRPLVYFLYNYLKVMNFLGHVKTQSSQQLCFGGSFSLVFGGRQKHPKISEFWSSTW